MYQYSNKSSQRLFMQYLIVVFLIIIASLIYYNIQNENKIHIDVNKNIHKSFDKINESTEKIIHSQKHFTSDKPLPSCNCPSVDDIVSGIFPGRNTGLASGGNAFHVNSSDNFFETTPEYQYFETQDAFPDSSLFDLNDTPLTKNNPYSRSNNTIANNLQDTQTTDNLADTRMNKGLKKKNDMKFNKDLNSATRSKKLSNDPL